LNTILVFDLDNTLYPDQSGLYSHINKRMNRFIADRLHESLSSVDQIRTDYIQKYGTTQEGLSREHGIPPMEFLSYAHDISIGKFLRPNRAFQDYLREVNDPKYIFSNSPAFAIQRILAHLQIETLFHEIISIEMMGYVGKPNPSAFEALIQHLPIGYERILFFDDEPKNIEMGRKFGFISFLVNNKGFSPEDYYGLYLIPLIKESLS